MQLLRVLLLLLVAAASLPPRVPARSVHECVVGSVDMRTEVCGSVAVRIWDWAEVVCRKTRSAELFSAELAGRGFDGASGVAGTEMALVAEHGAGSPAIAA